MRVVLDTCVLIAALITRDTPPDRIYQAWRRRRFEFVTSEWQLDEFRRVSRYSRLRTFLNPAEAGRMVNALRTHAAVVADVPRVDMSPDPDDDRILGTAVAGDAHYLVSSDRRDVLSLGTAGNARIVSAREYVDLLEHRNYRDPGSREQ